MSQSGDSAIGVWAEKELRVELAEQKTKEIRRILEDVLRIHSACRCRACGDARASLKESP